MGQVKSYTETERQEILNYAKEHTLSETQKKFGVSQATIYTWRGKQAAKTRSVRAKRSANPGRPNLTQAAAAVAQSTKQLMNGPAGVRNAIGQEAFSAIFSLGLAVYGKELLAQAGLEACSLE